MLIIAISVLLTLKIITVVIATMMTIANIFCSKRKSEIKGTKSLAEALGDATQRLRLFEALRSFEAVAGGMEPWPLLRATNPEGPYG